MAFVSPLPPSPTGVARYSAELAAKIVATGKVDLDCYWDGTVRPSDVPGLPPARHVRSLERIEHLQGRYDDVVFTLGNSHHHLGALDVLLRRGGSVLAHDVRLSNLYRHRHGDPGLAPHGLERQIRQMYGNDLPPGLGHNGEIAPVELEQYGLLMSRAAIAASETYSSCRRPPRDSPGSMPPPRRRRASRSSRSRSRLRTRRSRSRTTLDPRPTARADDRSAVGRVGAHDRWAAPRHVRIVAPIKLPGAVIDAFAVLGGEHRDLHLAFVGPISDALAVELSEAAVAAGVADRVTITGPIPPDAYDRWMRATSVAVQLRASSNGEASATIGECLSLGVATVASTTGWAAELPGDVVSLVPPVIDGPGLAVAVTPLLADLGRRRALGESGRIYATHQTFDRAARELLAALELAPRTAAPQVS